jgi:hypothetical protein
MALTISKSNLENTRVNRVDCHVKTLNWQSDKPLAFVNPGDRVSADNTAELVVEGRAFPNLEAQPTRAESEYGLR